MASAPIGMQGISAAIVYTAINKISEFIAEADNKMRSSIDSEINAALDDMKGTPDAAKVSYSDRYSSASGALSEANLTGDDMDIEPLPLFLDNVVGSFFEDYLSKLDLIFPGMSAAGADAETFVRNALASSVGMSYNEFVDSAQAETAFQLARRDAFAQERQMLGQASAGGHRFAPGQVMDALARMHGSSIMTATDAIKQAHAERLAEERSDKMRMIRASLDTSMDRVKKMQQQIAEAFKLKLQARKMWINDQNQVVDSVNGVIAMNEKFDAAVAGLMRRTATRRFGLEFTEAETKDRTDFLGKLKMMNANEVVDLFGNMVTTLMNQVSASGGYSGNERDVTDYNTLLA